MATVELSISDCTDLRWFETGNESLETRVGAIVKNLERRVEGLAKMVASSRSARTEQGLPFTAYCNGAIKLEGEAKRPIGCGSLGGDDQFAAFQRAAEETFETILANKPVDADLLIWRIYPEASRELREDGLFVAIYTRLAWDKIRDAA